MSFLKKGGQMPRGNRYGLPNYHHNMQMSYGDLAMTYNFDPDRWYENELATLRAKYLAGKTTTQEFEKAANELDRKHEDMWKRIDGSYQVLQKK